MSENLTALRLKELRAKRGISQDEVSEACCITRVSLARYESGARFPKAEILANLAGFYDVSIDYLLGREDAQPETPEDKAPLVSTRMREFMEEVQDLSDNEIEVARLFLKQLKKSRE